jgi:hypothetical protein
VGCLWSQAVVSACAALRFIPPLPPPSFPPLQALQGDVVTRHLCREGLGERFMRTLLASYLAAEPPARVLATSDFRCRRRLSAFWRRLPAPNSTLLQHVMCVSGCSCPGAPPAARRPCSGKRAGGRRSGAAAAHPPMGQP